jgi:hypothetical protein
VALFLPGRTVPVAGVEELLVPAEKVLFPGQSKFVVFFSGVLLLELLADFDHGLLGLLLLLDSDSDSDRD